MGIPTVVAHSGSTYETDAADNNLTINKPAGTLQGHLMVALFSADIGNNAHSAPTGWTELFQTQNSSRCRLSMWYKEAGASEPSTYDFSKATSTGTVMGGGIITLSGHNSSSPIETVTASNYTTGTTTSADCPSITISNNDCLILRAMCAGNNNYTDNSTPSGNTIHWADDTALGADLTTGLASKGQATAGTTGVASFTGFSPADDWIAATIAVVGAADAEQPMIMLGCNF